MATGSWNCSQSAAENVISPAWCNKGRISVCMWRSAYKRRWQSCRCAACQAPVHKAFYVSLVIVMCPNPASMACRSSNAVATVANPGERLSSWLTLSMAGRAAVAFCAATSPWAISARQAAVHGRSRMRYLGSASNCRTARALVQHKGGVATSTAGPGDSGALLLKKKPELSRLFK